ncbi:hypothetical protein B0H13DRAFT_1908989 [Mycena leptocephala]|nr:hypothetical protein B0H13DRAFT_1908989 [Mycena leptocephala]
MASVGPTPVKCHEPTAMALACSVNANLNFVVQNYWQNVEIFHAAERQGRNINNGRQGSSGYKRPAPLEFSTSEDKPNVPAYIGTDMVHSCTLSSSPTAAKWKRRFRVYVETVATSSSRDWLSNTISYRLIDGLTAGSTLLGFSSCRKNNKYPKPGQMSSQSRDQRSLTGK